MKKKCSNESYHGFHDLEDMLEDIEAKVKAYEIQRKALFRRVQEEIDSNPSQEIFKIKEQFDQAALPEVKLEMCDKLPEKTDCRYYSKGFCRYGSSCNYSHNVFDCSEHISIGKCSDPFCKKRHKEECRYEKKPKGCNKPSCQFLHRSRKNADKDREELEIVLDKLKLDLQEKDHEIMNKKNIIGKLKEELIRKKNEIKEKEKRINIMKHTFKSSDDYDEDPDISDNDTDSTFDFAQLELDVQDVIQENVNETKENDLKCKQCEYKCKRTNTLKKHIKTKHGAEKAHPL